MFHNENAQSISALELYINGRVLKLRHLKPENSALYPPGTQFVTDGHWIAKCTEIAANTFGLTVYAPNGDVYLFDATGTEGGQGVLPLYYYASQVTDKHGNWVKYENIFASQGRIHANDGREIRLFRDPNTHEIIRAEANGRTWHYGYESVTSRGGSYPYADLFLTSVTRPDGKSHSFDYNFNALDIFPERATSSVSFFRDQGSTFFGKDIVLTFTHAEGATVTYRLETNLACQSRVFIDPVAAEPNCLSGDYLNVLRVGTQLLADNIVVTYAQLQSKTIVSSGETSIWQYTYEDCVLSGTCSLFGSKFRTHVLHGDKKTTYTYDRPFAANALHSIEVTQVSSGTVLSSSVFEYDVIENTNHLCDLQVNLFGLFDDGPDGSDRVRCLANGQLEIGRQAELSHWVDHHWHRAKTKTTTLDGSLYVEEYQLYNSYDSLMQLKESNDFTAAERYSDFSYRNDVNSSRYQLYLPDLQRVSSDGVSWTTQRDWVYTTSGDLLRILDFNLPVYEVSSRHPNGLPRRVFWGDSANYEQYENYHRGQPKVIRRDAVSGAGTTTFVQEINDDGTIKSVTDHSGNKTSYQYDSLRRLTLIDPEDPRWANDSVTYRTAGAGDPALVAGYLVQEHSKGSYQLTRYLDQRFRPVLDRERDTVDGTSRYTNRQFDTENRLLFESYQSASAIEAHGIRYSYDVLGRPLTITQTVSNDKTEHEYLSANRVEITDAKGNVTTTSYRAFGAPDQSLVTNIVSPEGVTTNLIYNLFDNVVSISQGGVIERYVYDAYQRLCKRYRPETLWTYLSYYTSGHVQWKAQGIPGSASSTSCDRSGVAGSAKQNYVYDGKYNIDLVTFGDSTPDLDYSWDEAGNLKTLTFGSTLWQYTYNSLNLVETQSLSVDSKVLLLDPVYDSLGYMQQLTYPSGQVVTFGVNALGQVKSIGAYITSATYHPSGPLKTITYGNGVTYTANLNSRKLPRSINLKDSSGQVLSDLVYGWDKNLNIDLIQDYVRPAYTISLTYDGLDRLKTADGYWGFGTLTYDVLGNIKTKNLGSQTLTYNYDVNNRLDTVTGANPYTFGYDVRGNVMHNGKRSFDHNMLNNMIMSDGVGYRYDGHGRRIAKTLNGDTDYSMYGLDGTLYYRQEFNGDHQDYIYLNGHLISTVESR